MMQGSVRGSTTIIDCFCLSETCLAGNSRVEGIRRGAMYLGRDDTRRRWVPEAECFRRRLSFELEPAILASWSLGNVPGNTERKMQDEPDGGSAATWSGCLVWDTWEARFKRSLKQSGARLLGLFGMRLCGLCRPPRRVSTAQKIVFESSKPV